MDKLDRSIQDTERFIVIEQQVLQGSVAMAAAQRRSSKGGAESNTLIRQAELGIDQSKERLEFLRGQLEKKKRRRQGAPKVEEKKWTNQLGEHPSSFFSFEYTRAIGRGGPRLSEA